MFLSWIQALIRRPHRPRFSERDSLELATRRRGPYLAAVRQAIDWSKLRGNALHAHRTERARQLVEHAYLHLPFYRELYRARGYSPVRLRSPETWSEIPIVDKADFRRASVEDLRADSPDRPASEEAWLLSSSGSTGVPSRMFRDAPAMWHFMARSLAIYREWTRQQNFASCLYILDFAPGSVDLLIADLLRTTLSEQRILTSSLPAEDHVAALRRFRPDFLSSYPSTLRNMAMALCRRNETCQTLRRLHLTSEMLDRGTRTLLARAFPNARLIETYTSTEAGLIAAPCAEGRLHVLEDGVLCEIVDARGQPTEERGEIVVTDLTNFATPVIRYRGLGDFAQWDSAVCPCGSAYRTIRQLEGRVAESIQTPSGGWLSPYELIDSIEDLGGIYQFQIVQHPGGDLEIRVVPDGTVGESARLSEQISAAILGRVPGAVCRVEFVPEIRPETGRHKVPLVVSRLKHPPPDEPRECRPGRRAAGRRSA